MALEVQPRGSGQWFFLHHMIKQSTQQIASSVVSAVLIYSFLQGDNAKDDVGATVGIGDTE